MPRQKDYNELQGLYIIKLIFESVISYSYNDSYYSISIPIPHSLARPSLLLENFFFQFVHAKGRFLPKKRMENGAFRAFIVSSGRNSILHT